MYPECLPPFPPLFQLRVLLSPSRTFVCCFSCLIAHVCLHTCCVSGWGELAVPDSRWSLICKQRPVLWPLNQATTASKNAAQEACQTRRARARRDQFITVLLFHCYSILLPSLKGHSIFPVPPLIISVSCLYILKCSLRLNAMPCYAVCCYNRNYIPDSLVISVLHHSETTVGGCI